MGDKQKQKEFMRLAKRLKIISDRMERKYGPEPEVIGSEMDEFISFEDEVFKLFGLTSTEENQVLIQNLILGKFSRAALYASYSLLEDKGNAARTENLAPLDILYKGIIGEENVFNVLPKMGISNHEYQIYLYNLILQHPELIVELYNEMMRAEPYLNDISVTKGQYERLLSKNIRWLQPFLDRNQSWINKELRVELN